MNNKLIQGYKATRLQGYKATRLQGYSIYYSSLNRYLYNIPKTNKANCCKLCLYGMQCDPPFLIRGLN